MDPLDFSADQDRPLIEYQSVSSECSHDIVERPERLHEWLKSHEIEQLHERFVTKRKLSYAELREELEYLNITFNDLEYQRLFLKINQNRDFKCDWNEFVSYLIFGFQDDDPSGQKEALTLPISSQPMVRKSEHKSAVCCISLMKIYDDDEDFDEEAEEMKRKLASLSVNDTPENTGVWITGSKEGQIRFWSPNLEPLRSGMSESIHLKMSTWILAIQALSDVSIVCTSSTERELRFHETVASTFTLRIVVRSMPYAVCCMSYSFFPNGRTNSRLVLGDYGGNVRILEFNPHLRGPFQSKPGAALVEVFWSDIIKGKLPQFIVHEYPNIHSELIQQTFYSMRLNSLFSAAEYRNTKKYRGRCPGLIVANGDEKTIFRIPLGVTTFFVDEKNNIVVTGGPDTFVRIWDVYIPGEPSGILTGHNGGIVMVFVQPDEKKVYSVDYQKIIKVWDLTEHVLLQTYGDLVRLIPGETDLAYYYHPHMRVLLVGGRKLVALKCNPRVRVDLTDGNTHAAPVSVVLYNRLFRNVVTCGLDSYIIVWDPWTGRRKIIMKNCHTKQMYGENIDIEITAACFDPLEQFLLTGARDGSLKIWNYNNAVCIRNMSIRAEHEVTAVIWVVERILAVGWDMQVTEFNDAEGREYGDAKKWPMFHTDDITCADVKLGEGVITATYSGELIFWKLETGQPYRRYNVATPDKFIELKYHRPEDDEAEDEDSEELRRASERRRQSYHVSISRYEADEGEAISLEEQHSERSESLPMSVQAVLFLQTRPMNREHGSVFVSLETGVIQIYSHHHHGGYLDQFNAIHKTGDCVLAMATDRKNRYLFNGTAFGYIKIWYIENFGIPEKDKVKVNMPLLRLQFIFLRNDRFLTRSKRAVRHQTEPLLVSSYKGHLRAINSIAYINQTKILITGSHDCSCRLWSLGGRYLGTLGSPLPWMKLSPFESVEEKYEKFRMPPDIQKVASSTTMKVITGQQLDNFPMAYPKEKSNQAASSKDPNGDGGVEDDQDNISRLYGQSLRAPILGKHFQLPGRSAVEQRIDLDITASYIPVFTHLKIHEANELVRPSTPPAIRRVATENYMDFYEPKMPREGDSTQRDSLKESGLLKPRRRSVVKPSVAFGPNEERGVE
ncbi:WD repeat-containing protein on Y chromosome-like [Musca vetustissima]|uniref:WD repeat-containing protein on Y chromosome-like n=1 Tax=Musca vetustissima TaxID=27455 RepID=UPI002AB78742|nr:WD repeat-containing protein on Y chromosome-like [Musca vetustissima]